MKIIDIKGDVTTSTAQIIAHQVNCQGAMNSGVAKFIRDKWPVVFEEYHKAWSKTTLGINLLGKLQLVKISDTQFVANLFAQLRYGYDGKKYTSYDALDDAIRKLAEYCVNANISTIAIPYKLGCGRGGADWEVVKSIVTAAFRDTDVTIEVWNFID
jgi:O-acetyl-ADP-ribose deacetylase (regulator of RNase III)